MSDISCNKNCNNYGCSICGGNTPAVIEDQIKFLEEIIDEREKHGECPKGTHETLDDALGCWKCQNASRRARKTRKEADQ